MTSRLTKWLMPALLIVAAAVGIGLLWRAVQPQELGPAFASGNGRIEATEIDISTKLSGRLEELLVDEGDFVRQGDVVARMDTDVLEAQLAQAAAEVAKAENATRTAAANVALRKSEETTAVAVVAQRKAELTGASKRFERSEQLAKSAVVSEQEVDDNRASMESARAALAAAEAQVLSAKSGIAAAESQVIEAEAAVAAAKAAAARVAADIKDSELKAPRSGRIQYRVAEVGEVLAPGGKVLNMIDVGDVYMTFFLPTSAAGRVEIGQEVRLVIDALPQYVIPSNVSYVASVAQFTPKTVETASEREKLMFRVKAKIPTDLLQKHITHVKTGVPGMAYLRLDDDVPWPDKLQIKVPE